MPRPKDSLGEVEALDTGCGAPASRRASMKALASAFVNAYVFQKKLHRRGSGLRVGETARYCVLAW